MNNQTTVKNSSGLWKKPKVADYLFIDVIDEPKRRLIKLNNWIDRNIIPRSLTCKLGREIFFFEDLLKNWVIEQKGKTY